MRRTGFIYRINYDNVKAIDQESKANIRGNVNSMRLMLMPRSPPQSLKILCRILEMASAFNLKQSDRWGKKCNLQLDMLLMNNWTSTLFEAPQVIMMQAEVKLCTR